MYERFFKWVKNKKQSHHYKILKDHVYLMKHLKLNNTTLFGVLKDLPFIEIAGHFYKANECYDPSNSLFYFAYFDMILPQEYDYNDIELKRLLIDIGLKNKCTSDDCLKIARKLESCKIPIKEHHQHSMLLLQTVQDLHDLMLIEMIKSIKFVPSEFCKKNDENQMLMTIYNPIDESNLVCLAGAAFGSEKLLAWIEKPILPKKYKNVLNNELCNELEIEIESSFLTIANNLDKMIQILNSKNGKYNLLNRLNSKEMKWLKETIDVYYVNLQRLILKDSNNLVILKKINLNLILVQNRYDKTFKFVNPELVIKNINYGDQIDEFMYWLDPQFDSHWQLFKQLGSNENVSYEKCISILKEYYNSNTSNLNIQYYNEVLIIIKMLFYDDVISESSSHDELYFPNALRQLKPLKSLYYINDSYYEKLLEKSGQIKEICLFDEMDLVRIIKKSINENSNQSNTKLKKRGTNFLKDLMLQQISWKNIFQTDYFFSNDSSVKPKPLSDILTESILNLNDATPYNEIKTNILNSHEFIDVLSNCISQLDGNFGLKKETQDVKTLQDLMDKFLIYTDLDEIKTCFYDKRNGQMINDSEREKIFVCLKSGEDGKIKFYVKRGNMDTEDYYFYFAETILESVQDKFAHLHELRSNAKTGRRFLFLITKLLKCETTDEYITIIANYKSNSFFNSNAI